MTRNRVDVRATEVKGMPSNGASLAGRTILIATAPFGVTRTEFRVTGGTLRDTVIARGKSSIYGWLASWNTSNVRPGRYRLWYVAYSGRSGNASSAITITVNPLP